MLAVCGRQPEPGPALYMPPLLAAVGLFLVLQALAPSSAKPSAASSRAGLLASSQQSKAPPPPSFQFFGCKPGCFSRSSSASCPRVLCLPSTSVLDEKFWAGSDPSLGFMLQSGQSTRMLGGDLLQCDSRMLPRVPKPLCGRYQISPDLR